MSRQTICSNQYSYSGNTTQLAVQCVASWQLTQQQVLWSLYAFGALLVFSGIWHLFSRRQKRNLKVDEIGFSLRLRQWGKTSRFAIIMNRPVQLVVSLGIMICMGYTCNSYEVTHVRYYIMTGLYAISLVDDAIRFCAARHKLLYCLSLYTILEILCIMSHVQVGYAPAQKIDMGGGQMVESRTWLEFSVMRTLFIYRSYLEMESNVPKSTKGWMMARLGVRVLLMIGFGASVMFFLETLGELPFFNNNGFAHLYSCPLNGNTSNTIVTKDPTPYNANNTCTETWSVMFSYYFTVVTLGTVGYGDMAPKTVLSRLLAIMFIVGGVILFSMEIDHLITLYKSRLVGNPPYKPKPNAEHVVIAGNPTFAQLSSILRELFHEDHGEIVEVVSGEVVAYDITHAVVLGERKCQFTKPLIAKLEADPIFAARVTYVAGSATNPDDLDRCEIVKARAAFVFPNKLSGDAASEDSRNIMRVLSIKRHVSLGRTDSNRFRCLVVVLRAESIRHMLAAGVARDDIVCENLVKMATLAQGVRARGISTMLANLASSLSIDTSIGGSNSDEQKNTPFALWRATKRRKSLAHSPTNEEVQINFDMVNEPKSSVTLVHSKRRWLQKYYEGAAKEMYQIKLAKRFIGITFSLAALQIFNETNGEVVLIAIEMAVAEERVEDELLQDNSRVLLNPGSSLVLSEGIQVYVIADDIEQVFGYDICADNEWKDSDGWQDDALGDHYCKINDSDAKAGTPPVAEAGDSAREEVMTPQSGKSDQVYHRMTTPNAQRSFESGKPPLAKPMLLTSMSKIKMDQSLERIAKDFRRPNNSTMFAGKNSNSFATMKERLLFFGQTRFLSLQSTRSLKDDRFLKPPSLEVLLHPRHIVVCSFLGEESLATLQWFLLPLRNIYNREFVPVTILDAAAPSVHFMDALSQFGNVYYVQGSPLSYQDLQRAGAKSAYGVVILSKRKNIEGLLSDNILAASSEDSRGADDEMESSVADAEAIFSTMLVRLKMDFSRVFTITELTDESNSKFMGMPFQFGQSSIGVGLVDSVGDKYAKRFAPEANSKSFWDQILSHDLPKQVQSEQAIFGIPLFMSGRLMHPHLCENMLVQTFYNTTIHKIIRQLVGGPHSTGMISSFALPYRFRQHVDQDGVCCTYGQVFQEFAMSKYSRILVGIYRMSSQDLWSGVNAELPIVITAPTLDTPLYVDDQLFVLIGAHTLTRSAKKLQHFFRLRLKKRFPHSDNL